MDRAQYSIRYQAIKARVGQIGRSAGVNLQISIDGGSIEIIDGDHTVKIVGGAGADEVQITHDEFMSDVEFERWVVRKFEAAITRLRIETQ